MYHKGMDYFALPLSLDTNNNWLHIVDPGIQSLSGEKGPENAQRTTDPESEVSKDWKQEQ